MNDEFVLFFLSQLKIVEYSIRAVSGSPLVWFEE